MSNMFNKVNLTPQFEFKRPSFLAGTVKNGVDVIGSIKNRREGNGNWELKRNNFLAPQIKGREMIDFEKLQAQDISEGGIKVQFGEEHRIEEVYWVKAPTS